MRAALALALALLVAAATPSLAADKNLERRMALAAEMVEVTQAEQLTRQITDGMLASQQQAMDLILKDAPLSPRQREEIIAEVAKVVAEELAPAIDVLTKEMTPLLADIYTAEEMEGILAFYKSPAGAAMLAKQSTLMQRSMAIGQQWNAENLPGAMARMQTRIEAIIENAKKGI